MIKYKRRNFDCPIEFTLEIVGGRWKPRIIWFLQEGCIRFGELSRMLPDTTRKVLIQKLKELERDRIVNRKVYAQVPPKVEYSLTPQGRALVEIFKDLQGWGEKQGALLTEKGESIRRPLHLTSA